LAFSRDGNFLYASQNAAGAPFIAVFDGHTMQSVGQVPDASIQGVHSEIEEADETQLLVAIGNRGITFIDAANPKTLPSSVPSFAAAPAVQPSLDHSPAAHPHSSLAKILNPALKSNSVRGWHPLPSLAPRKFKLPLRLASRMAAST